MSNCAIFLDIDGCILSECGSVNADYYNALLQLSQFAKKHNPSIRLCSGRDRNSVEIIANLLGIVNCWQIIENGAYLFNPTTQEIKRHPAITPRIQKTFEGLQRKKIPCILKQYPSFQLYPGELTCITLVKKRDSMLDMEKASLRIRQMLSDLIRKKLLKVKYSLHAIYIAPPKVSKGSAARFLAKLDNIDLSASLAIGDSEADISLFRQVRYIGCPYNASEPCKRFVRQRKGKVSLSNYAVGVVDLIEYFYRT